MGDFKCDKCDKEFDTDKQLSGHMMGAHKRGEEIAEKRKKRIPVGVKRQKLNADISPGKVGRWVNDKAGRLQMFEDGGYEFVKDPEATDSSDELGSRKSKIVDSQTGMKAYLMQIDKELYDEDQAVNQARNDAIDNRIKSGRVDNNLGDAGYTTDKDGKSMIKYEPKPT